LDQSEENHDSTNYSILKSFKFLLLIVVLSYLISMYYILRYNFLILDSDAIALSNAINALLQTEDITQSFNFFQYSNGILYQLFSYIFIKVNNITIVDYQQIFRPILGSFTIFSGILFFYIFFKKNCENLLISLVLFLLSPVILSQSIRASHALLSFSFFLISLYLFVNYIRTRNPNFFLLLCMINFSFSVTNLFFAFILTICQIILLFYFFYESKILTKFHLLNYQKTILLSSIMFVIFIIGGKYTYNVSYDMMTNVFSIIYGTALKTTSESLIIPVAYTYISTWKNPFVYWGIIYLYNITILPFSLIIYFVTLYKYYFKKRALDFLERFTLVCFSLFGLLVLAAIFIDLLGLQIGSNLQLRLIVFIIPFCIVLIVLFSKISLKIANISVFLSATKLLLCLIFLLGALIYITGDPYFSNSWRFTDNNEKISILWINDNRIDSFKIWLGEASPSGSRIFFVSRLFEMNLSKLQTTIFDASYISSQYLIESNILTSHSFEISSVIPTYYRYNKIFSITPNNAVYFNDKSHNHS